MDLLDGVTDLINCLLLIHLLQCLGIGGFEADMQQIAACLCHQVEHLWVPGDIAAHLRRPCEPELQPDHFPQELLGSLRVRREIVVVEENYAALRIVMRQLAQNARGRTIAVAVAEHSRH